MVDRPRSIGLELHQRHKAIAHPSIEYVGDLHAEALQFGHRQIHPTAARIVAYIADDVDQLQCQTKATGIFERGRVAVAEDRCRHLPDDAGDAMRVSLQRLEIEIAVLLEVHFHAVEHVREPLLCDAVAGSKRL